MPGFDGTGPFGEGPNGRGMGPCGRGFKRGNRGFGRGRGGRRRFIMKKRDWIRENELEVDVKTKKKPLNKT